MYWHSSDWGERMKTEFSKKLLYADYIIMIILLVCTILFPGIDFIPLDVGWIAQIGVSSAAYYWKAKSDNRIKVPVAVVQSLPEELRKDMDLTQIITTIIQSD